MNVRAPFDARTVIYEIQRLEGGGADRRSKPGRAVIARSAGAKIGTAAAAVATRRHVVESAGAAVRISTKVGGPAVDSVNAGDQGSSNAGSTEHHPARTARRHWTINRNTGVRIGNRRYVCNRSVRAQGVVLPAWLAVDGAASAASAIPDGFGPAARIRSPNQAGASNGSHMRRGRRKLDAIAIIA